MNSQHGDNSETNNKDFENYYQKLNMIRAVDRGFYKFLFNRSNSFELVKSRILNDRFFNRMITLYYSTFSTIESDGEESEEEKDQQQLQQDQKNLTSNHNSGIINNKKSPKEKGNNHKPQENIKQQVETLQQKSTFNKEREIDPDFGTKMEIEESQKIPNATDNQTFKSNKIGNQNESKAKNNTEQQTENLEKEKESEESKEKDLETERGDEKKNEKEEEEEEKKRKGKKEEGEGKRKGNEKEKKNENKTVVKEIEKEKDNIVMLNNFPFQKRRSRRNVSLFKMDDELQELFRQQQDSLKEFQQSIKRRFKKKSKQKPQPKNTTKKLG